MSQEDVSIVIKMPADQMRALASLVDRIDGAGIAKYATGEDEANIMGNALCSLQSTFESNGYN